MRPTDHHRSRLARGRGMGRGAGQGEEQLPVRPKQSHPPRHRTRPHPASARAPPRRRARPLLCLSGAEGPAPHRGIRRSHLPPRGHGHPRGCGVRCPQMVGWVGLGWDLGAAAAARALRSTAPSSPVDDEARVSAEEPGKRNGQVPMVGM
jgi:hypothetical protein